MYKVIGHTPPDTDTVCSPIVYAWYLTNIKNQPAQAYITGELNNETAFVLEHFGVQTPALLVELTQEDEVILMDTNNVEEVIGGFDKSKLIEIVDHHKWAGGITTSEPINMTLRTYGCTATVLWEVMGEDVSKLPKDMAGLMLACIISDTLKFASPTTTQKDGEVAQKLAEMTGQNIDELAQKMFEAKSNIDGYTAADLLRIDDKTYPMGDKKIMISVLETTMPELSLAMRENIINQMQELKIDEGINGVFFFVVDIIQNQSTLIVAGDFERRVAEITFGEDVRDDGTMVLPGVVSRKKQIAPKIEETLKNGLDTSEIGAHVA